MKKIHFLLLKKLKIPKVPSSAVNSACIFIIFALGCTGRELVPLLDYILFNGHLAACAKCVRLSKIDKCTFGVQTYRSTRCEFPNYTHTYTIVPLLSHNLGAFSQDNVYAAIYIAIDIARRQKKQQLSCYVETCIFEL